MNDATTTALAKTLAKSAPALKPGEYRIDETVTLHIHGTVRKGADAEYTPTVDIPLLPTLALVLEKAGFMREHAKALLIDAMTAAANVPADEIAERLNDINAAMAHVRAVTAALPKKTRAGATTVKVEIEELEFSPAM